MKSPDEKICMRCKCLNNRMDDLSKTVEKLQHAVEALLDTPQRQSPSEPHPPRARDSNNDEREGQRRTPSEPHPPRRAQDNNGRAPPQSAATERRHGSMAPSRPSQPGRPPLPQHFRGEMHPMEYFLPLPSRNTGPPPPPLMMRNIPHPGTRPFGFAMPTPPTFPRGPGYDSQLLPPPMPQFPPHPPFNSFHMSRMHPRTPP